MTQTSTTRRVATVCGGALLLCLSFGGTALAATTPASGSSLGPVTGVADPLPLPTPSATTDPVGTVVQTVQQVSQAAGVPVPTATPTATPAPAPGGKTGADSPAVAPARAPKVAVKQPANRVLGTSQQRTTYPSAVSLATLNLGGLRSSATVPTAADPVVAPAQTAILAAGQSPALAPRPGASAEHPFSGNDERAPRGLFIALATMVIGALAAGHVKVIQDRLNGVSAA